MATAVSSPWRITIRQEESCPAEGKFPADPVLPA
jgi:hypothetical protein